LYAPNGGKLNGQTFFSQETLARMTMTLSDGLDHVFQIPTAFSAGFMKDSRDAPRRMFGPSTTAARTGVRVRNEPNGTIRSA